jgi:phosphoribosylaminoimidazole-succinocarboxamide synthase
MGQEQDSGLGATDLALPDRRSGKVRDVYRVPGSPDRIAIIATDRISAFDVVLPTLLPGKGRLLTEISLWWMRWIADRGLAQTHILSTNPEDLPDNAYTGKTTPADLRGRLAICKRCEVVPIECVVRGYLEGSGWRDYQKNGSVSGVALPPGLRQCDRLPEPIFTPSTKAEPPAHDEAISFDRACDMVGRELMEDLRARSLAIYSAAAAHALERGIIIADTKFEFGFDLAFDRTAEPGAAMPILIDEALTPDSSRFWPADAYEPGHAQPSFDKQFVREYLETLVADGAWDKTAPGPELPAEIAEKTLEKYAEAVRLLTS